MDTSKYRNQIFSSIIISIIITIASSAYLFSELKNYLKRNDNILNNAQQQLEVARDLNSRLYKLTQRHIDYIRNPSYELKAQILSYHTDIKNEILQLESLGEQGQNKQLSKTIISFAQDLLDEDRMDSLMKQEHTDVISFWLAKQEKNIQIYNNFVSSIFDFHNQEFNKNKTHLDRVRNITLSLIILSFFTILFTYYLVYQSLKTLRKSRRELKKINQDFVEAQKKIDEYNWILEKNNALIEEISGVDDEREIAQIIKNFAKQTFPLHALAIYFRKDNSDIFELYEGIGLTTHKIEKFTFGEQILGQVAATNEIYFKKIDKDDQTNGLSNFITRNDLFVFINPLSYEDEVIGVIEVALDCKEEDLIRYRDFFRRANRNLATRIRFGQNHRMVRHLLEEAQVQHEELEAQQEELRITNEELVQKTNLLESSEEELRVQQEELTQINQELNRKAEELELRNQELHQAQQLIEQKIKEVEQASKYKSEFMANMSHELRTPLNSILILAKLLQDNKQHNLNEEQIKYAQVIHDAGSDLLQLINQLLDLAKIEAGHIELNISEIEAELFVKELQELFRAIAEDKNITFRTSIAKKVPKTFLSDEYRLQQVIKNFLSNAFKFTEPGGEVRLDIQLQSNNLYFDVIDTGKGISKDKQDLIFEAFRQEDGSTSRKYGGTGLGLSISKELASLLGGRITLESEVGKGSKFTLILPLQEAATKPLETISAPQNEEELSVSSQPEKPIKEEIARLAETSILQQKTILIIEDDVNFADILKGFAENYGFSVMLAHDGAKGIEIAKTELPSAIILDVMLPIVDGWEVLRTLKEEPATKHIPIHMMSAATFSKKDFLEKGAIGFMHKPVTEKAIQKTFEDINLNLSSSVKKILLVEDQELQSDHIKNSFASQNINVIQTFSLNSAWNKLNEENNIDCIILDLSLPDGNGLELIERIKENKKLSKIPIIINTAYELPKDQYDKTLADARATILKSDKSSDRLIDEVNLFLNKLQQENNIIHKAEIPTVIHTNNLNGKRVLIADDDMRNVFALSTSLESYNMHIEVANNGKEAIEILKNPDHKIDIVLMDIMMPEMDGYEAIQYIRNVLNYKDLPIIAVTAKAMKGDREKSIQIGANDYVSKPIDIDKLTSLMQVWLG